MADEPNTSGAAPAATPVTPPAPAAPSTSPDAQAADGNSETITLEAARKLRSEAEALRKRLKAFEDAEQAKKDAQLSEVERLNKQYADMQEQQEALAADLFKERVFSSVARYASKFDFVVSADTLTPLLLMKYEDEIEFEDGKPTNIEKLLEKLAKSEPGLLKPAQQDQQQRAPMLPAMDPGRSNIASPSQNQQGQTRSLFDKGLWKT